MRLRFSTRLILSIISVELIMSAVLVSNSVRHIHVGQAELFSEAIHQQSTLLANTLIPGLITYDRAVLEDTLALIKDRPDLVYAEVFDSFGERLAYIGNIPDNAHHTGHGHDANFFEAIEDGLFDLKKEVTLSSQHLGTLHIGYSTQRVEEMADSIVLENSLIIIITLLMIIAVTVVLGLLLSSNIAKLKQGAQQIHDGNLDYRIDVSTHDEIGDLARTFNRMATHLSVTQQLLTEEHQILLRQTSHLSTLLNSIDAVIWEAKADSPRFKFVSQEAVDILGYSLEQWMMPDFLIRHAHPNDLETLSDALKQIRAGSHQISIDVRFIHKLGKPIWTRIMASSELNNNGELMLRGLIIDISEEKKREERIVFLADHDALTGLINRRHFQEHLEQHIAYGERYGHQAALLFIDLDQFKYINDTYGHQAGDNYLIQVSHQLQKALRATDILGRLGGDEFGIILPVANDEEACEVAEHLLNSLTQNPWQHDNNALHISASIGITFFPQEDANPSQLLAQADAAMYTAKELGRNRYHRFTSDDEHMERMHAKVHWEGKIRDALNNDGFVLYYQPIINLNTGKIAHYEALLRIVDEDGELILPSTFIDTAERFGLIHEIDRWVIVSCIQFIFDRVQGNSARDIAINLSGRHIGDQHFLDWLTKLLSTYRGVAQHIIFEVTETAAVENISNARTFIDTLRGLGCRFALDDFGVGFSSFHYIKHLPVDYIKIDGSFVHNLHNDHSDKVFIKATVDIADSLGIKTIAEFVENAEIVRVLQELGAHMGQGNYLGEPQAELLESSELLRYQAR